MENKDFLFSIIVPVYNTEKYIEKSMDSIMKAIDKDCEVIFVNDGSTDKSKEKIMEFMEKLPEEYKENFRYTEKENKGLADTKNVGIELSRGKFISVVDSDDYISDDFYKIAKSTIEENGYLYDVTVEIGNFSFPTKNYGDISLPAGYYDALRVKIGNAEGRNWWCVMFPPLCFVNVTSGIVPDESKELMKEDLTDEEYSIITNENSTDIQFKIGLIEWFMNNDILTAKK